MRVLNLGVSTSEVCGVRDYARVLADELGRGGHEVRTEWLERRPTSRDEPIRWIRALPWKERLGPVDAVLWHYSVFAYGSHGIPTVSYPLALALRRARLPVVTILHEYAFPWGREGWHGSIWAASQRLALPVVVGASTALVVTVNERADWLRRRLWLPRRPTVTAPVFSNLPDALVAHPDAAGPVRIGMFGYSSSSASLVTVAMARLRAAGGVAELWLLGEPGPTTVVGKAWRQAGSEARIGDAVRFTGVLAPEALARELAGCHIVLFDDGGGPSSRKTTLAAGLASGRPVVAVDGPNTWPALARSGGVRLVAGEPEALSDALLQLTQSAADRDELGARGRIFYNQHQARAVVADVVAQLLDECSRVL